MNQEIGHLVDAQSLSPSSVLRHDCPVCGDAMDSLYASHGDVKFGHSDGRECTKSSPADVLAKARQQLLKLRRQAEETYEREAFAWPDRATWAAARSDAFTEALRILGA